MIIFFFIVWSDKIDTLQQQLQHCSLLSGLCNEEKKMNKPIWTIHQINKEDELNKPITKETVMLEKFPLRNLLPKYIFF